MKYTKIVLIAVFILTAWQINYAQNANESLAKPTPPISTVEKTPDINDTISKNLAQIAGNAPISRDKREQSYAKLLEGQRNLWKMRPPSTQSQMLNYARLAKESLQKAVELNPTLAEGYTALAEVALSTPPYDLESAVLLANIAVKVEPENFGGHRILARLYTIKSRLNSGILDTDFTQKAITEWKEIVRLDPRNAEAFAFLSEFYGHTKKRAEQIDALNRWLASAASLDSRFYSRVMGGQSDLTPETAIVKLGGVLLATNQIREAVETLSRAVADNPENEEAVELLAKAIESADESSAAASVQALQQAVYTNPENATLAVILAQVQERAGKIDDAAKTLRESSAKIAAKDKISSSILQVTLGDVYTNANRFDEAASAYNNALMIRGIGEAKTIEDAERDFAIRVFDKMIDAYKKANRLTDAKAVIDRARIVLGKADLFADKRLVSFYIETGKKNEALQAVRALRARNANDYSLLRLEASILTETGKVDEAVALVKTLIGKKTQTSENTGTGDSDNSLSIISSPTYDDFSNYLFISGLYSQSKRGKEAVEAANQAASVAQGAERKQIAQLTLATAQQMSGDFKSAETTLREILKQSSRNPIALNNLGYFLSERGEKLDEALEMIKKAVEIDPTNPSYLDSLGWVYFQLGNFAEAEKNLKDALRIDDSSATIHEHLGDVYQKQGKTDLAKTTWQKALTLTSNADDTNRIKAKINNNNSK